MRKLILAICPLLIVLNVFGQLRQNSLTLSIEGQYYKKTDIQSINPGDLYSKEKIRNIGFSAEYFVSPYLSLGLGLGYNWNDYLYEQSLLKEDVLTIMNTELENQYWEPRAFIKYYIPVIKRLYVVPQTSVAYATIKSDGALIVASRENLSGGELTLSNSSASQTTVTGIRSKLKTLNLDLSPALVYFVGIHWSLNFYPGGLRYNMARGDIDDSEWSFGFKPEYWRYGLSVVF